MQLCRDWLSHMGATGVRHSRRLAALTESDSGGLFQDTTQAASSHGSHAASTAAAAGLTDWQKAQHHASVHQSQSHSPSLLQASTMEASANVLKGLVIVTGTTFCAVMVTAKVMPFAMNAAVCSLHIVTAMVSLLEQYR